MGCPLCMAETPGAIAYAKDRSRQNRFHRVIGKLTLAALETDEVGPGSRPATADWYIKRSNKLKRRLNQVVEMCWDDIAKQVVESAV